MVFVTLCLQQVLNLPGPRCPIESLSHPFYGFQVAFSQRNLYYISHLIVKKKKN